MRSHSYINSAKNILEQYKGEMPLASWLKTYFAAHKKYGSKDRKQIAHLCYSYYRLGHAFKSYTVEERLLIGVFISSQTPVFVLKELRPEWNELIELTPLEKLGRINAAQELDTLNPWKEHLSTEINASGLAASFLVQPFLFLRIRPGRKRTVLAQLTEAQIDYQLLGEDCIAVDNGIKLEDVLMIDRDVVVQDFSSQQVLTSLKRQVSANKNFAAWDCCAASGGKSILLKDAYPGVRLTATDIRESILHNLRNRLKQAGINQFNSYVVDVSGDHFKSAVSFELVLCDAPCSGSGTWSRTPEQLYFFQEEKIDHYTNLQKRIATNAASAVKKDGFFLYITCSVFRKENEEVVAVLEKETNLKLIDATYHKGYNQKADTLFSALFQAL